VRPDSWPLLGVDWCGPICLDAKVTKFEVQAKKTLITLESESTVAARAWVFLWFAQFYLASIFCDLLLWALNVRRGQMQRAFLNMQIPLQPPSEAHPQASAGVGCHLKPRI
jgi:hypothetical protein